MVLGSDTFAGDLLARLGVANIYDDHAERYPRVELDELRACGAELGGAADEPYQFTADDGPEAFPGLPAALVSGRHSDLVRALASRRRQLVLAGQLSDLELVGVPLPVRLAEEPPDHVMHAVP